MLAIDPGRTTGVAILHRTGVDPQGRQQIDLLYAEDVSWDDRFKIATLLDHADVVVIESFHLMPEHARAQAHIRSDFPSIEIIGMVEAWARAHAPPLQVIRQQPSQRKAAMQPGPHPLLKGLKHAKDAYRHGRVYIVSYFNQPHPTK